MNEIKKFEECFDVTEYEVWTDDGWVDIDKSNKTIKYEIWELKTENNTLKCADTHIVFDDNMCEVFVCNLHVGDHIQTESGWEKVVSVNNTHETDNMYDLTLCDESNHRYYTDGILSHNTTTYTIFTLHHTIFHPEKKVMIAANKRDTALEILGRIQLAYEHLPNWLKPGILEYNKGNIKFSNLSQIQGCATGSSSARGFSAGVLILDELAFVQPLSVVRQFWNSVYPIVSSSSNSKVIVVSTPNGSDGLYYELWEKATSQVLDDEGEQWIPFKIMYWDVPGRDEKWVKQQKEAIGIEAFNQEFGCDFLSSKTPKLVNEKNIQKFNLFLDEHKEIGKKKSIESKNSKKEFEYIVYHEYRKDRTYLLSFDVGDGVGQDSSVCYVWDVTDLSNIIQCAKYSSNISPTEDFAYIIYHIHKDYNKPWVAGEANSIGQSVIKLLQSELYNVENFVSMNKGRAGILSHAQIKSKACRFVKNLIEKNVVDIKLYDEELIKEMDFFVKKDTVKHVLYEAVKGKHDDHMMAMIWAMYVLNDNDIENYFKIISYMTTSLGNDIPHHLQSLLHDNILYTDTRNMLDIEYQKESEKEYKYIKQHEQLEKQYQNQDYFEKNTNGGIIRMMEKMDELDDGMGMVDFMAFETEEW